VKVDGTPLQGQGLVCASANVGRSSGIEDLHEARPDDGRLQRGGG